MAKVFTCPSCQAKGAIPDEARSARIKCPKCGTIHRIGDEPSNAMAAAVPEPSRSGPPRPSAAPPPPPIARSAPAAANPPVLLYALLGVSGLVVVLLGVVVTLLMKGGGDRPGVPSPIEASVAPSVPPSELAPPPSTAGGPIAPTSATTTAVTAFNAGSPAPATPVPVAPSPSIPDRDAPPDPVQLLKHLKDATVLINTKIGKRTIGNGSGFVIEADADRVIVATNRHVAVMDLAELPPGLLAPGTRPALEAVFRSGSGKDEQAMPAQIIAADLSGDMSTDLAFLVVKGVQKPPKPIDPFIRFEPLEGLPYVGAGFPLGGMLSQVAESRGNPSVTITRGGISALRRDDFGQLSVLQVDGSLQPGNSGGPIIDAASGKLVGVAVAKVSAVDTIGFVVPAEQVRRALGGRVGGISLTLEKSAPGKANLLVKANLVDPKLQVSGVVVRAAPLSAVGKLSPNSDGSWPALPNTQPFELQRNPRAPSASGHIEVALAGTGNNGRKVWIQAAHRDMRGRVIYSRPKEIYLPDQPGPIREAGSVQRIANQVMAKSLALLGTLIDPSKDCRLDKDDKSHKVRIDVPGKLHTISPEIVIRKNVPVHNAPMTLADVDGDFLAQVSVTGEMNPGDKPPTDRAVRGIHFTFQSAGLVLYQDKNNFVRLERAASVFTDRLTPVHRLLVEVVRDGQQAIKPIYLNIPEGDTKLLMIRRKGRLRAMFVPTGTDHLYTFQEFALDLPSKLKVGLVASNISANPFTATFQGFAIVSDATQIDQEMEQE